ncbi:MAG: NIPSNAP family protein [Caulobacteraceae bacterium]
MIVEMRTYTLFVGKTGEYLRHYQAEGLEVQKRILGNLVGYYTTEIGEDLNQIIHLWGYADLNDRAARRAALFKDPTWLAYIPKIVPLLAKQESRILTPTSFSPGA